MNSVPVLVSYHSWHWIRVAVESYLSHFPQDRILVVDNNHRRGEPAWVPDCERERDWLGSHPGVQLVANPAPPDGMTGQRTHGAGIDLAVAWCRDHGVEALVHFEPDCLVKGRLWRDNMLGALEQGAWMAGSYRQGHGAIHPAPSAWLVREVKHSFKSLPWAADEQHPRFRELIDVRGLEGDDSPEGRWIRTTSEWDTGHKCWFEAAVEGRAALVPAPDLKHYWHGSWVLRFSETTFIGRYPELGPHLERARQRRRPPPAEQCPFREGLPGGAATCQLVREISGVEDPGRCTVTLDACRACRDSFPPAPDAPNPVVASLLYSLAEQAAAAGGLPGLSAPRADQLRAWAEPSLDLELP